LTAVLFALFLVVKKQNFNPFLKEKQSGNQGSVQSDADSRWNVGLYLKIGEFTTS